MTGPVVKDERTLVVENASYRVAYQIVTFGLLLDVAVRAFALKQSNWDLFVLVILGGFISTVYQGVNRVLSRRWAMMTALTMAAAAVTGAIVALLRGR